jgi:hypothetical protein
LGIAAFFVFLAFLRLTLILDAEEEVALYVKILFLRFKLTPRKKKPPNPKRYRIQRFRRERLKEEKRHRKRELAKEAAARKKAAKKAAEKKDKPKRSFKENVAYGIDIVTYIVLRVLKAFGRYLRVDIHRIAITVSCDEPDKTAVTYGYVSQSVAYLKGILEQYLTIRYPRGAKAPITVGVDYLKGKSEFKIHMAFHIRVWQVIALGVAGLKGYLAMPKHEPKAKNDGQSAEPNDTTKPTSGQTLPSETSQNKTPATAGKEA